MKVHSITLKDYNQFTDLVIDLTYPKGHPKEGKPLDKVCFIGQSGTGKTTLLRLIKFCVTFNKQIGNNLFLEDIPKGSVAIKLSFNDYIFLSTPNIDKISISIQPTKELNIIDKPKFSEWDLARRQFIKENKPILVHFPTERINAKKQQPIKEDTIFNKIFQNENQLKDSKKSSTFESFSMDEPIKTDELESLKLGSYIDFSFTDSSIAWDFVLADIKKHQAIELEWKQKIANEALKKASGPSDLKIITDKYQDWLTKNPNPLEDLASYLDQVLKKLGLKIKTDIDKESILQLGSILLQTLDGKDVNHDFWSTGTKQIVDTLVPLYEIKPKNAIVLIDEPERSLYPDLQQEVIEAYTSIGENCQYIFATHSPIIASSFDPWEIVELKFDESNSYVIQELNYSEERHVDNYTVYPKYLGWSGILMKLFDLKEEGNKKRNEELLNLVILKNELDALKKEGKTKGKPFEEKLETYIKLKQKVGWNETA